MRLQIRQKERSLRRENEQLVSAVCFHSHSTTACGLELCRSLRPPFTRTLFCSGACYDCRTSASTNQKGQRSWCAAKPTACVPVRHCFRTRSRQRFRVRATRCTARRECSASSSKLTRGRGRPKVLSQPEASNRGRCCRRCCCRSRQRSFASACRVHSVRTQIKVG